MNDFNRAKALTMLLQLIMLGSFSYFSIKLVSNVLDPTQSRKKEAQKKAQVLFNKLNISNLKLDEYEIQVASQLIDPSSINISWSDICGLDSVITKIRSHVILPMKLSTLDLGARKFRTPTGILLYGPPGCGKTMLAKATAKGAGARFINLDVSVLTDKWYGESQKFAKAVFTLARKIQPSIIFIDEIDTFLRSRDSHDHEATAMVKAQFMKLWDGLETDTDCHVIVMGATNRPRDVDSAILRRMPAMYEIKLPGYEERLQIIAEMMDMESWGPDIDIERIAEMTDGFSGSDLREVCRAASMTRLEEFTSLNPTILAEMEESTSMSSKSANNVPKHLRLISMSDVTSVIEQMSTNRSNLGSVFGGVR